MMRVVDIRPFVAVFKFRGSRMNELLSQRLSSPQSPQSAPLHHPLPPTCFPPCPRSYHDHLHPCHGSPRLCLPRPCPPTWRPLRAGSGPALPDGDLAPVAHPSCRPGGCAPAQHCRCRLHGSHAGHRYPVGGSCPAGEGGLGWEGRCTAYKQADRETTAYQLCGSQGGPGCPCILPLVVPRRGSVPHGPPAPHPPPGLPRPLCRLWH